jgi:hypothetical protein
MLDIDHDLCRTVKPGDPRDESDYSGTLADELARSHIGAIPHFFYHLMNAQSGFWRYVGPLIQDAPDRLVRHAGTIRDVINRHILHSNRSSRF